MAIQSMDNINSSNDLIDPEMMNNTDIHITTKVDLAFAIFIPILCFFIVIGNLATIIAFLKIPSLHEVPSEYLVLSLSCADLTTGLVVIPLFSPMYITPAHWPFGEVTCQLLIFFMDVSIHASLFTLCAISLDRFLLVLKEYSQYIRIQSQTCIRVTIITGWIISFTTGVLELSLWEVAKTLDDTAGNINYTKYCLSPPRRVNSFALTFFLTLYLIPVLLVCGLSLLFFGMLHQKLKHSWSMRAESQLVKYHKIHNAKLKLVESTVSFTPISKGQLSKTQLQRQVANQAYRNLQRKRYIKPAITLLALVTAMALCMLPYSFYVIAVGLFCTDCSDWSLLYILLLLQFCNACIDPFIYAMTQKKIQMFYKSFFRQGTIKTHKLKS